MFDKKKKRSSSLVREVIRDTDWPDSVSMAGEAELHDQGQEPTLAGGQHTQHRGRKFSSQHGQHGASGQRLGPDRKTDLEKLYWSGDKADSAGGINGNRQEANGFNHSDNAAFDEIEKSFWNEKRYDSQKVKNGEEGTEKENEQKRRGRGGQITSYQTYQQQFGSETVEKFYWNDKIPGEDEDRAPVKTNKQTPGQVMAAAGHSQIAQVRKPKLNGMREFQNFNDEEKLYWNEKLHQVSAAKQSTRKKEPSNGYHQNPYQNFPDDKLGWPGQDKPSTDMFGSSASIAGALKHQQLTADMFGSSASVLGSMSAVNSVKQQQGLYRAYLQQHEAATSRWRGVDKKQLAGRLQGYCGRPASSLGMAGTGGGSLVGSPSIRYNRTRRSSMSYYEENNRQSSQYNLQAVGRTGAQANIMGQGIGRAWRSNSMDVLPYVESDSAHFSPALAQIAQLSKLSQQQQLTAKLGQAAAANQKLAMMRSNAFETATQFTDQYSSALYPTASQDPTICAGVDSLEDEAASLVPAVTRPGVSSLDNMTSMVDNMTNMTSLDNMTNMTNLVDNLTNMASMVDTGSAGHPQVAGTSGYSGAGDQGKSLSQAAASHGGSNEDMKKVLMELDNTGYFAEELLDSSEVPINNNKVPQLQQQQLQQEQQHQQQQKANHHSDYKKLWEESKLHNSQLQKELTEVKTDLESVRCQLENMAIRAVNQKSVSDGEKREKLIVIKKLEGLEKELKLLAYSESLTDQTLEQLRVENNRLREENLALLRVMDKIVKN